MLSEAKHLRGQAFRPLVFDPELSSSLHFVLRLSVEGSDLGVEDRPKGGTRGAKACPRVLLADAKPEKKPGGYVSEGFEILHQSRNF